ncbi:MAG: FlgD immunoglobulin-like domain containing protein [Bacteroidota bacterium]|nr:hypothetical protein [Candidatus Kapabacteria bacterium]MCX7936102.1 hypothetical protein [Chlorobiota bacterium]MDW8075004.1 FlgD immunoglobulin-like domain containing protein [Bacteroidota bacterium]
MVRAAAWKMAGVALTVSAYAQQVQPPLVPPEQSPASVLQQRPAPSLFEQDTLPGGKRGVFSPEQDTFYLRALQLELPPSVRLALDVQRVMSDFELIRRKSELESPWQAALRNMTLSQRVFTPDPREIVQRQVAIASATSMPIWRTGQSAPVSIPVSAIGSFLGLTEDVSPRISYRVRQTAYVQAVVYSTTALIVRRLFAGEQRPGVYDLEWDGRDDKGRSLPEGDYVIEVRIGTENIVRKRVVLSSR